MVRLMMILAVFAVVIISADEVRVVREGMALPDRPGPRVVTNVIRFLASSSYQSTAYAVKSNTWETLLESDSYVQVKLRPARTMNLFEIVEDLKMPRKRAEVVIDEIIVPLPEEHGPAHIYARSGTNVVSHTKFHPGIFKELIQEPALRMQGMKVYKEYSRLPRGESE